MGQATFDGVLGIGYYKLLVRCGIFVASGKTCAPMPSSGHQPLLGADLKHVYAVVYVWRTVMCGFVVHVCVCGARGQGVTEVKTPNSVTTVYCKKKKRSCKKKNGIKKGQNRCMIPVVSTFCWG